jgi:hypothetical protein
VVARSVTSLMRISPLRAVSSYRRGKVIRAGAAPILCIVAWSRSNWLQTMQAASEEVATCALS